MQKRRRPLRLAKPASAADAVGSPSTPSPPPPRNAWTLSSTARTDTRCARRRATASRASTSDGIEASEICLEVARLGAVEAASIASGTKWCPAQTASWHTAIARPLSRHSPTPPAASALPAAAAAETKATRALPSPRDHDTTRGARAAPPPRLATGLDVWIAALTSFCTARDHGHCACASVSSPPPPQPPPHPPPLPPPSPPPPPPPLPPPAPRIGVERRGEALDEAPSARAAQNTSQYSRHRHAPGSVRGIEEREARDQPRARRGAGSGARGGVRQKGRSN